MKSFAKPLWPHAVIVVLWLLFSAPYFLKGLVPFPSDYLVTFFPPWSAEYGMPVKNNAMPDVITQIYPWKQLTIDTWKSGEIPLWNPYSFSGTPHAGNYQSAVFSPFNLLFFVLPFIDAWSLLILLQPLLAGILMYVFVNSLGRSKEASLLSGVAFMFCGFLVVWMAYGTLGYAALWLPLIFWGIHRKRGIAISAGIALSLLSGHFQTSVYVVGASVGYILWKKQWKTLLYVAMGTLIAAPQILLGLRSFALSTRGAAVLKGEIIPWNYLITLVAPDFFGNPVTRNDWFGHYAEWAGFVGVIPLMLAIYAGIRKKTSDSWFFITLLVLSLALALPTPLNDLLYILKIPVLSGSAASRIIILASFSLAALSAFGLDTLRSDWKNRTYKSVLWFGISAFAFVAVLWGILLLGKPFSAEKLVIATRNFLAPSSLIVAGVCLFGLGFVRNKWLRVLIISGILVATAFDVMRFAVKWMPFQTRELMYPSTKSLMYLSTHAGYDRVFGNIGAGEVGTRFRIPLVEGYDAVYPARYGEFVNAVSRGFITPGQRSVVQFDKNGLYKKEALQLLGIKYIYHSLSDGRNSWVFPYWEYLDEGSMHRIYSDEKYEIFQYNDVYPRAFLASSYKVVDSDKASIDTLFAKNFDRRNTVVLSEQPAIEPSSGTGSATITSYTPNRVKVEVEATSPKLLVLSDTYDEGWQVTVDGKRREVYRADYILRAVPVPAGTHLVEFRYQPEEFRWGIILSIIGLTGLVIARKRI